MRENFSSVMVLALGAVAAALLAGCGDFWLAPGSTGTSTGTTTTTTLTPSTSTPTEGASVTLTATVTPAAATGTVTFYDNSASMGTGTLDSGTATLAATFTTTGAQSLTASYGGSTTYASSTSSPVTVTVGAASTAARTQLAASPAATDAGAAASNSIQTTGYGSSPIHAIAAFNAKGGSYTAQNGEAVVVEGGGSVTLNGAALNSAAGAGYGVLFSNSSPGATPQNPARFTMTGGSITYNCPAAAPGATCAEDASAGGQSDPATAFSVSNAKASISLTDVAVTNNTGVGDNREGTLLVAGRQDADGDNVTFTARGTTMTGNVLVDASRTAALSLLQDDTSTGSSLTGAINQANAANAVSLTLDGASIWTVTATSYVTTLSGLDISGGTVNNVDGGGHCVYYSGSVDGASEAAVYALSGGGFLAPRGTTGLACH